MSSPAMIVPRPEQANALQRLKLWDKLAKGELHTITRADVEALFAVLDTEERGEISRDDLLVLRQIKGLSLTAEDVDNLVNDADKDNSGKVNQDELFKALTQGELAYSVVLAALGQKKAALKTTECDKQDLIEFLRSEYESKSSLWSLPQTCVLFVCFFACTVGHLSISTSYAMQNALVGEIEGEGKPYLRSYVHDVPTMWDWMGSSFIGSIFKSGPGDLEIWPYPGRVASYNQIIGGVSLVRQNSVPDLCAQSDMLRSFYDSRFGGRCHKQDMTTADTEYMHYHNKKEELVKQIMELRANPLTNASWIDQNTSSLTARMLLYNGHLEAFTDLKLIFAFNGDGAVKISIDMATILSDPYSNILWLIPDIIFALIVLRMFYSEMLELVPSAMNGIDGFQQYMQFWNIVDWFAIIVGIVVMTTWGLITAQVSSTLQSKISNINVAELDAAVFANHTYLTHAQFETVSPTAAYNEKISELHTQVDDVVLLYQWLRIIAFFYYFVLMMKFFKAFQANPRLNIVIKTMQTSAIDIIHFLIVFLVIFFVFSSAAYVFFGSRMKEFSSMTRSMMYCWRILMGEFDVEAMEVVSAPLAYLWILVFQFLVLQVLLNMLLAIIMDTYAAVNTPGAETIWAQIREALHTARETRGHLDMWYLICEFEDDDLQREHPDRVTSKSLRSTFETQKMTKHNADYLIRKTVEYVKAKEAKCEIKLTDALRIISRMQSTSLRVQETVETMHGMMVEDRRKPQEDRYNAIWSGQDPDSSNQNHNAMAPGYGATTGMAKTAPSNARAPMLTNGPAHPLGNQASHLHFAQQSANRRISMNSMDPSRRGSTMSQMPAGLPGMMPSADDNSVVVGLLEQQQMTLDGIRSDQLRIEQNLIQELRDFRIYVEQRESWLEQRLNGLDRRFEKVERATDRLTTSMQGFDFRELMGATERVAHFLQLQQRGLVNASSASPSRPARSDDSPPRGRAEHNRGRRASYGFGEDSVDTAEYDLMTADGDRIEVSLPPSRVGSAVPPAGGTEASEAGLTLNARKHITTQLERIGEQVQQLVSHAEESVESRRLLWKIDLNLRQTRTSVQKIEELGLRQPQPAPTKHNLSEGFARKQLTAKSLAAADGNGSTPVTGSNALGSAGSTTLGRLPAVPDGGASPAPTSPVPSPLPSSRHSTKSGHR